MCVNPFQKVLADTQMKDYRNKFMYEVPPHIYALAEDVFRSMVNKRQNVCVIITGESGAGKTFQSKIVMEYISYVSAGSAATAEIMEKLLLSNPILEAFGNAKTVRNDNSSRFGKYMQLEFDMAGAPLGGEISQYLLEKSRVVTRAFGERSYHIFYQLLTQHSILGNLQLHADPSAYQYLSMSGCYTVNTINDANDYTEVVTAMQTLKWARTDFGYVTEILASILHLGNVVFQEDVAKSQETNTDCVEVVDRAPLMAAAKLLQIKPQVLNAALTTRTITTGFGARKNEITVQLDMQQAVFARDALAMDLYHRVFKWVVERLNDKIKVATKVQSTIIGILDIYGFEIFENNSLEQLFINYCNEKLQQYFIQNVLRSEQDEYMREGIEWTEIDYFDNQPIISLIEGKGKRSASVIALLDEACLVGQSTPRDLVDKFSNGFRGHDYFETNQTSRDRHLGPTDFRIHHYAGAVVYSTELFLEKNRDQLNSDIIKACVGSAHRLVTYLYRDAGKLLDNKKRPETAGSQFRRAVCDLVSTLQQCEPHYIRCIKSNDEKRGLYMDRERVDHQVTYLNLVETVRVRKAGFCNRQHYQRFLWRYKLLTNSTWPNWHGSDRDGVATILHDIGVDPSEYRMGNTKVFIKDASTFMMLEQMRFSVLPDIAILIQKNIRRYLAVKWYKEHRVAMQEQLMYTRAASKISKAYLNYKLRSDMLALWQAFGGAGQDPYYGKYTRWPEAWPRHADAFGYFYMMWQNWWAYKMVTSLSFDEQTLMREKILAMDLFSGKKPWVCGRTFHHDYLNRPENPLQAQFIAAVQLLFQSGGDTAVRYSDNAYKVNKKLKSQLRSIIVTDSNIYKYEPESYQPKKVAIPIAKATEICISTQADTVVVVKFQPPIRDLVLDVGKPGGEHVSEFCTVLYQTFYELTGSPLTLTIGDRITFNNSRVPDPKNPGVVKKPGKEVPIAIAPRNSSHASKPAGVVFGKGKGVLQAFF